MTVRWPALLDILRRLIDASEACGKRIGPVIVLVGGSAMAAHGLRADSRDVDMYTTDADDDVVASVEREMRPAYGPDFRIDITTIENIWGIVMVRDIASSPKMETIRSGSGQRYDVRVLSLETLYVLKVVAGREQDISDIDLIVRQTTADAIIARFNMLLSGIGNRTAIPAIADLLVDHLVRHYGLSANQVIDRLMVSDGTKIALREARI